MRAPALVTLLALTACSGVAPSLRSTTTSSGIVVGARCDRTAGAVRELEAVRHARTAPAELADVLRAERAILASRGEPRSELVAEAFAEVEADAEKRIAAAERLAATLADDSFAVPVELAALRRKCSAPSQKIASTCERFAQMDRAARWDDARSVAAFADDLDALLRGAPSDVPRPSTERVRRLAGKLRAGAADRAIVLAPQHAAARAERRVSELLGACVDGAAMPLVVAKDPAPRSLTVIVTSKPPASLAHQFEGAARETDRADLAAFYRGVASGRLGSGFALVTAGPEGARETYVVTNRHVVDYAESVAIELEGGGTVDADVAYIDAGYDVAVLVPRDGGKRVAPSGGFDLAARAPRDGEAVIATGYPAMLGQPSFQLTRGHVSNENLLIPDGTALRHVQHTAAIDPGSSGGPLLGEHREVLGVNTFKLVGRENVNIAVPASAVLRAVTAAREAQRCDGPCRARAAEDACLSIASELRKSDPRVTTLQRMLGRDIVASRGIESHDLIVRSDAEIYARLRSSPVATLSEAVARRLAGEVALGGGVHPLEVCASVSRTRDPELTRATFTLADGSKRALVLRWEAARWVLADFAFTPEEPVTKTSPKQKKDKSKR